MAEAAIFDGENVKEVISTEINNKLNLQSLMDDAQVSGIITGLGFSADTFKKSKETRKDFMTMLGINPTYFLERSMVGTPVITLHGK